MTFSMIGGSTGNPNAEVFKRWVEMSAFSDIIMVVPLNHKDSYKVDSEHLRKFTDIHKKLELYKQYFVNEA